MIKLPEWVLHEENYKPSGDRDYFISRSLLRIMNILRALRYQSRRQRLEKISAAGALCFVLALIIFCAVARTINFLLSVLALELVILCLLEGKIIWRLIRNSLAMSLFSLIFVLPAFFMGHKALIILLPFKTFLTVTALGLLTTFFRWHDITRAMKLFRVPNVIIFILDTTLRYIVLLGEISRDMLTALKSRSVGRNQNKTLAMSGILGTVFIKSKEMSAEMYKAMICRGFTGEYFGASKNLLRTGDIIFALLIIFYGGIFYLTEGI